MHKTIMHRDHAITRSRGPRACLPAKCIVQDDARTLITSANLTEAAQLRNIEAGVLVSDAAFARATAIQFERLIDRDVLRRLVVG